MNNPFLYPAFLIILVFWGSFWFALWVMSRRMKPLVKRVQRLEKLLGRNTEDFQQPRPQPTTQPKPYNPRIRYITVEKEMR